MSYLYVMVALRMYEAGLHTESARNPVGATVTDSWHPQLAPGIGENAGHITTYMPQSKKKKQAKKNPENSHILKGLRKDKGWVHTALFHADIFRAGNRAETAPKNHAFLCGFDVD